MKPMPIFAAPPTLLDVACSNCMARSRHFLPLHRSRRRKECSRCSLQAAGCLFLSLRSGSGEETHLADPATAGSLQSRSREALLGCSLALL
mmetsp:Transcript_31598/g.74000  ORF Transcript_31598/g.74000 Transcript_31598/m.74000 type:complete len:91 (-) Transcript_31598:796-1068(-)